MTELFLFPFIVLIVINCEPLHDGKSVAAWVVVFSILEFKLCKDSAVQFVALGVEVDVMEQQVEAAQWHTEIRTWSKSLETLKKSC